MNRIGTEEQPISLKKWQEMFKHIYGKKDRRDYTPLDLLLHIQEEAAKIDEGVRKEDKMEILNALPHLFCWLLSFCNMVEIELEEVVWEKYQEICPYCGKDKNCMCITEEAKPSEWFRNPDGEMPCSLGEWQEMFRRIYGRINKMAWLIQIWLHVHEELGEVSRAFRLGQSSEIKEELADSFAWLISFCNRLDVSLNEIAWKVYPGRCDVCGEEECQCSKV